MKKLLFIGILFPLFLIAQTPAFPSVVGAGAYTTGGRGGIVVHVTNLNDSGTGSLREALMMTVPRTIVFDVSGRIHLTSHIELILENSDFTVAGQTAPEGGITISGRPIQMGGGYSRANQPCHNAIWRYIRFRNGSYTGASDVYMHNGFISGGTVGLIFDHCSFSFNDDQAISMNGNYSDLDSITVQRCLFSENATSIVIDGNSSGNAKNMSFINNLWKNEYHRQPNYGGVGQIDIINNIHDNFPSRIVNINKTGSKDVNYIGNWIRRGPTSTTDPPNKIQTSNGTDATIYTANNYHNTLKTTPSLNDQEIWSDFTGAATLSSSYFTTTMHPLNGLTPTIESAAAAFITVTSDVGANKYLNADGTVGTYLDSYDTKLIDDTVNGIQGPLGNKSWTQPTLPNNTRPSGFDTDGDGIPDDREDAVGLDKNDDTDGATIHASGYSNLEYYYLNNVDSPDPVVSVDGVIWNNDTQTVYSNGYLNLNHTFSPTNATNKGFSLSSSNTNVISNTGAVVGEGTATLTITTDDGSFTDTMSVIVNAATPRTDNSKNPRKFFLIDN